MARSDHWIGLNDAGEQLVSGAPQQPYGRHTGAYYNEFPLMAYFLEDGRTVREVVQTDLWHGGPHWFTSLVDADTGKEIAESQWSDQELADVMGFQVGDALPRITDVEERFFADFADSIQSGQMNLAHSDRLKFDRWLANQQAAVQPGH